MKKTVLITTSLILTTVLILTVLLSIDLTLNLRIRRKAFEYFGKEVIVSVEPKVIFLDSNGKVESSVSKELIRIYEESNMSYFDLLWLRPSGITYHLDTEASQLNIVGPDLKIVIDQGGNVFVNDVASQEEIPYIVLEENVFVPYEVLERLSIAEKVGFNRLKTPSDKNIIFYSDFLSYKVLRLSDKRPIFETIEQLDQYYTKKNNYSSFYRLKNIFSETNVLGKVSNEAVFVYLEDAYTLEIVTDQGDVGFIRTSPDQMENIEHRPATRNLSTKEHFKEPIMMFWEAVYSFNPDTSTIPQLKGVNVASPTWYELSDSKGNLDSKVSTAYIQWAKDRNYHLWALVSNAFDIDRTHEFLHSSKARKHFIDQMIEESLIYGYEGINIDFEHIYMADKDALTHFINELAYEMRKHDLILSMDVTIMGGSDNWSKCYDHEFLGKIVDYLIIMAYDEHWAASPISGPVASYGWVYRAMENLVDVVEPNKLVLGLPFYTRVWRETPSKDRPNTMVTRSTAIGMEAQANFIERNQLNPIWDDRAKLEFASFIDEEHLVKIWIENEKSIAYKTQIVNELGLAGVAAWTRSLGTAEIWDVIYDILNE